MIGGGTAPIVVQGFGAPELDHKSGHLTTVIPTHTRCRPSTSTRKIESSFHPRRSRCRTRASVRSMILPSRTIAGPPPMAVGTPARLGQVAVNLDGARGHGGAAGVSRRPSDNTMQIPSWNWAIARFPHSAHSRRNRRCQASKAARYLSRSAPAPTHVSAAGLGGCSHHRCIQDTRIPESIFVEPKVCSAQLARNHLESGDHIGSRANLSASIQTQVQSHGPLTNSPRTDLQAFCISRIGSRRREEVPFTPRDRAATSRRKRADLLTRVAKPKRVPLARAVLDLKFVVGAIQSDDTKVPGPSDFHMPVGRPMRGSRHRGRARRTPETRNLPY